MRKAIKEHNTEIRKLEVQNTQDIKRWSTPLISKETQIKTVTECFSQIRKSQNVIALYCQGCGEMDTSIHCHWEEKNTACM